MITLDKEHSKIIVEVVAALLANPNNWPRIGTALTGLIWWADPADPELWYNVFLVCVTGTVFMWLAAETTKEFRTRTKKKPKKESKS